MIDDFVDELSGAIKLEPAASAEPLVRGGRSVAVPAQPAKANNNPVNKPVRFVITISRYDTLVG